MLALLALMPLRALAEIPDELHGQPVMGIRVAGESAQIADPEITGITPGEPLTRALVRAAILKLFESGRWVDVQVEAEPAANGVVLVFYLEPRISLRRIEVRGQDALDAQVARDALSLGAGAEVRADALPALEANVRRAYAERGFLGARVALHFRDTDDPSQKVLLVDVDEGPKARILELRWTTGPVPLGDAVFEAMGLSRGDVLDRRSIPDAVVRGERYLRSQHYFEAHIENPVITYRESGAVLTFPLHLGPHYRIEVRGATPLKANDIAEAVLLVDAPLTAELIDAMPGRIKDIYAKNGFLNARVTVQRVSQPGGRGLLSAQIHPGTQVQVSLISFPGAQHFTSDFLLEQLESYLDEDLPGGGPINTVDSEVVSQVVNGPNPVRARSVPRPQEQDPVKTYYAPTYTEAIKHISELYQAAGYLAAEVGPPVVRMLDRSHATVSIPVVEGPQTLLHGVTLRGNDQLGSQELLFASRMQRASAFSYLLLEEARLHMQELYQERGYMFARIEPAVAFSADRTRAEVTFHIVEGFPVKVSDVVVQGAQRTDAEFVRALLPLKSGQVFRPSLARESERNLAVLGVFTGISVRLEEPELPARVKRVFVTLTERSNQYIDFSAGLSTGQGVRGGFDYGYRNLFGRGVGLSLRVQFGYQLLLIKSLRESFDDLLFADRLERNITLGFVMPRPPLLGATRINLDFVHVRDNELTFGLDKNGLTLTFTETPWPRVTVLEAVDLENNDVGLFKGKTLKEAIEKAEGMPRVQRLLRVPAGNTTIVAFRLSVSYDERDSPFLPTRGFFLSASGEVASTLYVDNPEFRSRYLKLQITGSGYLPLGRGFILAGQARLGRIMHLGGSTYTFPNRAFFLGGVDTMRGYYQDSLMPQDVYDRVFPKQSEQDQALSSVVRSGDAFVLLRGELRFPIYGQLGAGLFADLGNLWRDANNISLNLQPTAGAGLRVNTPVGPIALDYGIVLLRRSRIQEPFGTLHFSIGLF
ncbi:MAG TPA: POTRA domain-containing protein [Polyangiales bacterium]|nr:POTRA domain-containing protein [Polyangiales bacterium]